MGNYFLIIALLIKNYVVSVSGALEFLGSQETYHCKSSEKLGNLPWKLNISLISSEF